jgi:hypothetical protein
VFSESNHGFVLYRCCIKDKYVELIIKFCLVCNLHYKSIIIEFKQERKMCANYRFNDRFCTVHLFYLRQMFDKIIKNYV